MAEYKRVWILEALRDAGLSLNRLAQEARASQGALHKLLQEEGDIGLRYAVALHRLTGMPLDEIARRCGHDVDVDGGGAGQPPVTPRKLYTAPEAEGPQHLLVGQCKFFHHGDGRLQVESNLILSPDEAMAGLTQIMKWARASSPSTTSTLAGN